MLLRSPVSVTVRKLFDSKSLMRAVISRSSMLALFKMAGRVMIEPTTVRRRLHDSSQGEVPIVPPEFRQLVSTNTIPTHRWRLTGSRTLSLAQNRVEGVKEWPINGCAGVFDNKVLRRFKSVKNEDSSVAQFHLEHRPIMLSSPVLELGCMITTKRL